MSSYINRKPWPKKLLVEGNDDLHVVASIRDFYQLPDTFEIVDCKSVSNIKPSLLSYLKTKVEVIGIIVDADADTENTDAALRARWDSLRDVLIAQDYIVPNTPDPEGTIIPGTDRKPKIGIWLMPDNVQKPGMLEHFVATLIPPGDRLKPIAEETLAKIQTDGLNRYKPIHSEKALIHTWLAWQEDPGTPMGLSITKTYLNHNSKLCQQFVAWLNTLFNS